MGTTFPKEIEGLLDTRTNSAQILAESEPPKMKFPKVIRHRKAEVTIYGKKPKYSFYRIAYRAGGKRHLRNFSKYGDALKAAEKKVRELAEGSQSVGLSAMALMRQIPSLTPLFPTNSSTVPVMLTNPRRSGISNQRCSVSDFTNRI